MTILIISGIIAILVVLTIIGLLSRYRKCASDEILVVFGKAGRKTVTDPKTKESKEVILPSKIIHGGGTFVWPVIQDYRTMSLRPLQIQESVTGLSNQNIKVTIPITLTTAIGTIDVLMQNAASRFLSATRGEITSQIKDILIGETRGLMATMSIEDINADRVKFLGKAKENIETELNKIGFEIININTADISDEANYIRNLGKKAATQAQSQAEADIAEQQKIGKVKIANTRKEEEIAVAQADKERATKVTEANKEQAVQVAEIRKEQDISLAEAEKDRQSKIAEKKAEQTANIAKAEAEATKAQAQAEAEAEARVAQAEAIAAAEIKEADAKKEIRIAVANQEKEAETIKAVQEKEAKAAEYESEKLQRKAEADKLAGVAEQKAKIDVAEAKAEAGKAEADSVKIVETAKVDAEMSVAKARQERQLEVNEAEAKAQEAKLNASEIVPAQKAKEKSIIEAEAAKMKIILEAEAEAAQIRKKAEAEANATRMIKEAEAEGIKCTLMAEAEGKKASLMAEAEALQQKELAPAMAFERMIQAAGSPEMAVQWKLVDHYEGIAGAQARALEHINMGNVTIWGDKNTGADFAKSFVSSFAPVLDTINGEVKDRFKGLFGSSKKKEELPKDDFEEVK